MKEREELLKNMPETMHHFFPENCYFMVAKVPKSDENEKTWGLKKPDVIKSVGYGN